MFGSQYLGQLILGVTVTVTPVVPVVPPIYDGNCGSGGYGTLAYGQYWNPPPYAGEPHFAESTGGHSGGESRRDRMIREAFAERAEEQDEEEVETILALWVNLM